MKTATTQLVAHLNSGAQGGALFDLWTITLQSGLVLRWTDADIDIAVGNPVGAAPYMPFTWRRLLRLGGSPTWPSAASTGSTTFTRGPAITRSRVTQSRGIEVGSLTATLESASQLIGSKALPYFAAAGGFEGAAVQLDLVYFDVNMALQGVLPKHFVGSVSNVLPTRMGAKLTVKPATAKLSQQTPFNTYQAGCSNNLYDANCGKNRADYTVTGTVSAVGTGSNPTITVTFASSIEALYFDLGICSMTGGANAGISRTVQAQTGTGPSVTLQFARPFPLALAVGDTLTASAGCNKTLTMCVIKFFNLGRFKGTPFIPVVETAAGGG